MFADLHLHTHFSDGTFSPEELVGHGFRLGFRALALTDHDTIDGCPRMAAACARVGIDFIPAAELTAELDDTELHIIGYHLDAGHERLRVELRRFQQVRQERIREMVARLNSLGIPLVEESVFKLASCDAPGRPHVARAMVQARLCATLDEAFEKYLKKGRPAWVPKFRISARDAIALIHDAGGLAVMAHPVLNRSDAIIPPLVEAGMDGLECFHTKHSTSISEHYLMIADRHGLLVTGGSDCHGNSKGRPLIGTIKLPYRHVEQLHDAMKRRRANRPPPADPGAPPPAA